MRILVITPIYPGPGVGQDFTKVVHYFTKEWKGAGHEVQVVSIPSYFPRILYRMPGWTKKVLNKKFGSPLPEQRLDKNETYTIDNIPVLRVPLFKLYPGARISNSVLKKSAGYICDYLDSIKFNPDVIVAHWTEPSLYFVDYLKRKFNCPTAVVTHVNNIRHYSEYIGSVDLWGYRRLSCVSDFKKSYPQISFGFRCYSGIPDTFIKDIPDKDFMHPYSYAYVGVMFKRKHPDKLIDAITRIHTKDDDFKLSLLGDGSMLDELRKQVSRKGLQSKISLPGRVERDRIISTLDNSDIFVMISEDEVFGLVYIEAMARGCIVIASKGEGMEGVIENGVNGFLVSSGNTDELVDILKSIHAMSADERKEISRNAISTAMQLTDRKVAENYLESLKMLCLKN